MPMMSSAGDRTLWWPPQRNTCLTSKLMHCLIQKETGNWLGGQVPATPGAWRVTLRLWGVVAGHIDHVETLEAEPSPVRPGWWPCSSRFNKRPWCPPPWRGSRFLSPTWYSWRQISCSDAMIAT